MRLFLLSFAAAFVLVSCQTDAADTSTKPFQGDVQKLYVLKCAKCHELYDPRKYSDADWEHWMVKMKKKSKLKPDQFDLIQDYTAKLRVPETGPIEVQPAR